MSLSHWLQLALTEGIGPILTSRLVEAAGHAQAACEANASLLRSVEGIGPGKSQTIVDALRRAADQVEDELARAAAGGVSLICIEDEAYPEMLKVISDPPPVLYVRGGLEPRDLNGMAIVGSRRCTHYGREQAERFGALLAQAGFTIISGVLGESIRPPIVERCRCRAGGRSWSSAAVWTSRIHRRIMRRSIRLPARAVLSEFPLSSPPLRENFPRRNRIISGLSRGVLVVEADVASGALITARPGVRFPQRAGVRDSRPDRQRHVRRPACR